MPLDASDQNQLAGILILAILLFIVASALPQKVGGTVLFLLVPFQAVETQFGTSSVVLAYVVFIALVLRREPVRLPMLPHFLFFLLWALISMSLRNPSTYIQHSVYIFTLISAILAFWLSYDLMRRFRDPSKVLGIFIISNVLVAIYCAIQLWAGPGERLVFFGIDELNMIRVRADGRLTGPFQSSEISALYFVIMEFIILHQFWYAKKAWSKRLLVVLAVLNLGFLVATGSRGEFLVLVGGAAMYLWLFRTRLGMLKTIGVAAGATLAVAVMAVLVVNYSQFGGLFERLEQTEFSREGIPDTRQVLWPPTWKEIEKRPILGHGPRFRFFLEERGVRYDDRPYLQYPHNLYLFLLFTLGVPGLLLFLYLLFYIASKCWRNMSNPNAPPYLADLARTGFLVIFLFLIDGLKIDQMRMNLADFWHFFFGLCGVFLAASNMISSEAKKAQSA